jgi:hypothetical protein
MFKRTGLTILFFAFIAVALIKVFGMPDWMQRRWDGLWAGSASDTTAVMTDSTAQVVAPKSKTSGKTSAPDIYKKIDAHALATPADKEKDIPTLAAHLVAPAKNDMEKGRAIFRWMADRISYDDEGYNSDNTGKGSSEAVLADRVGVCADYARLFKALAENAGLEVQTIGGLSKGYGYTAGGSMDDGGHAWNVFKADGKWHLVDATWAAGYGATVDGKLKSTKSFKPHWFDVDPQAFVLSHFPDDSQWQLLDAPLTKAELERMPQVEMELFNIGVRPSEVLRGLRAKPMIVPPTTYSHRLPIQNFSGPINKFVKVGEPIEFSFACASCTAAAVVQGSTWSHFKKSNGRWQLRFVPQPGEFSLNAGTEKGNYSTFLAYLAKRVVGQAS